MICRYCARILTIRDIPEGDNQAFGAGHHFGWFCEWCGVVKNPWLPTHMPIVPQVKRPKVMAFKAS